MQMHIVLSEWLNGNKLLSKYSTNSKLLRNIPHRSGICRFLFARNNNNYVFIYVFQSQPAMEVIIHLTFTLLASPCQSKSFFFKKATFCKYRRKSTLVSSGSQFKTSLLLRDGRGSHSAHGVEYWPFYELSLSFWRQKCA